jgi:mRNA interferase HicA
LEAEEIRLRRKISIIITMQEPTWALRSPAFDIVHASVYTEDMKKQELEKALRQLGWRFLRHGGRHDVWTDGQRQEAIPRQTEINDKLARAILQRARRNE